MFIYAIFNKSNNSNIFYSSTLAEACLEFNKHYTFDTHCIKRYQAEYDDDISSEDYNYILHACGVISENPEFSLSKCFRPDDDVDKGYTTTMERERNKHTNPKFRNLRKPIRDERYNFLRSG